MAESRKRPCSGDDHLDHQARSNVNDEELRTRIEQLTSELAINEEKTFDLEQRGEWAIENYQIERKRLQEKVSALRSRYIQFHDKSLGLEQRLDAANAALRQSERHTEQLEELNRSKESHIISLRQTIAAKDSVDDSPTDDQLRQDLDDLWRVMQSWARIAVESAREPITFELDDAGKWLKQKMPECLSTNRDAYKINTLICLISKTMVQFNVRTSFFGTGDTSCPTHAVASIATVFRAGDNKAEYKKWLNLTYNLTAASHSEASSDDFQTGLRAWKTSSLLQDIQSSLNMVKGIAIDPALSSSLAKLADQARSFLDKLHLHSSTYAFRMLKLDADLGSEYYIFDDNHHDDIEMQGFDASERMYLAAHVFPGLRKLYDSSGSKLLEPPCIFKGKYLLRRPCTTALAVAKSNASTSTSDAPEVEATPVSTPAEKSIVVLKSRQRRDLARKCAKESIKESDSDVDENEDSEQTPN